MVMALVQAPGGRDEGRDAKDTCVSLVLRQEVDVSAVCVRM